MLLPTLCSFVSPDPSRYRTPSISFKHFFRRLCVQMKDNHGSLGSQGDYGLQNPTQHFSTDQCSPESRVAKRLLPWMHGICMAYAALALKRRFIWAGYVESTCTVHLGVFFDVKVVSLPWRKKEEQFPRLSQSSDIILRMGSRLHMPHVLLSTACLPWISLQCLPTKT